MLFEKSILELSSLLQGGETSASEIAGSYLERIDRFNPALNAFITVNAQGLLEEAAASDARRQQGAPLSQFDGIPLAIKDNMCTRGILTTCASAILRNFVPPYDATAYLKLKQKGFLTLGKTNLDEFAMGSTTETSFFGPTKNPHDRNRVPGGSSGGSAASGNGSCGCASRAGAASTGAG